MNGQPASGTSMKECVRMDAATSGLHCWRKGLSDVVSLPMFEFIGELIAGERFIAKVDGAETRQIGRASCRERV